MNPAPEPEPETSKPKKKRARVNLRKMSANHLARILEDYEAGKFEKVGATAQDEKEISRFINNVRLEIEQRKAERGRKRWRTGSRYTPPKKRRRKKK